MRSRTGKKKKYIGNSGYTVFFCFFLSLPLLVYPLVFIGGTTSFWPLVFIEIPWFAFFFLIGGKSFFGMVSFSEESLIVKTSKPYAFGEERFSFELKYHDICGLSFTKKDGPKNNEINIKLRMYAVPVIELTVADDSKRYILLYPFSKKQWSYLENELLKKNPDILVLNSANDLLKKRGAR